MAWVERVLLAGIGAAAGTFLTWAWVEPDSQRRADPAWIDQPVEDVGSESQRLGELEEDLAAQAELLAELSAENLDLAQRLRTLERSETGDPSDEEVAAGGEPPDEQSSAEEDADEPASEASTAELLVNAGVEPALADYIGERLAALEMERLYVTNQATREGWRNSERYSEEMAALLAPADVLRGEFGDEVYDQYLYATGQGNRVLVASTVQDSPAELAGIRAGDTVLSYAGDRVFSIGDLQSATAAGEPGASVVVELLRNGVRWYATVPRGPLGVRLDITRRAPQSS